MVVPYDWHARLARGALGPQCDLGEEEKIRRRFEVGESMFSRVWTREYECVMLHTVCDNGGATLGIRNNSSKNRRFTRILRNEEDRRREG